MYVCLDNSFNAQASDIGSEIWDMVNAKANGSWHEPIVERADAHQKETPEQFALVPYEAPVIKSSLNRNLGCSKIFTMLKCVVTKTTINHL